MAWMTIGDVARRAGLRPSALRYYERLGLLPAPRRAHGKRCYDEGAMVRLAVIRFARYVGFSIREVQALLNGFEGRPPPPRWREMATLKLAEVDELIARAESVKKMLRASLAHKCPRLAERGVSLMPPGAP